jgi:RimJ/RimL family protein N-acetyltransferase
MDRPTFQTARLIVRPRTLADTEACLAMDRDPEVTHFIPGPWADPIAHRTFTEARTLGPYSPGMGYWSVFSRDQPDEFLGWVSLIPHDAVGPRIETGWRFRRAAWGRGYATEAAAPLRHHGLVTLGLDEIVADIDPDNAASLQVAAKLGYRLRAIKLKPEYTIGYYGLTREEWNG